MQHRLRQHCSRFWRLKGFMTSPSINYDASKRLSRKAKKKRHFKIHWTVPLNTIGYWSPQKINFIRPDDFPRYSPRRKLHFPKTSFWVENEAKKFPQSNENSTEWEDFRKGKAFMKKMPKDSRDSTSKPFKNPWKKNWYLGLHTNTRCPDPWDFVKKKVYEIFLILDKVKSTAWVKH